MVTRLHARSISRSVKVDAFAKKSSNWSVLAAFEPACDLVAPDGSIFALVLPEIGDGPLNVVVDGWPGVFSPVTPGIPVRFHAATVRLGDLEVCFNQAIVWEPRPNWKLLRQSLQKSESHLSYIQDLALGVAPTGSLLERQGTDSPYVSRVWEAVRESRGIEGSWWSAHQSIVATAEQLAGLGGGLTPAGDDFLAGIMLRIWLAHPEPQPLCEAIGEATAFRTNTLSAAFLRAAARGECSAAWHHLFDVLPGGTKRELFEAVREIVAHGHTSGADMLAGFLCLEQRPELQHA